MRWTQFLVLYFLGDIFFSKLHNVRSSLGTSLIVYSEYSSQIIGVIFYIKKLQPL
jgi:hypothetical protein